MFASLRIVTMRLLCACVRECITSLSHILPSNTGLSGSICHYSKTRSLLFPDVAVRHVELEEASSEFDLKFVDDGDQ